MRVLVTGGAGFIGSHVTEALIERGHSVVVLDNLSAGLRENVPQSADLVVADILDPGQWEESVGPIDGVIHLAAQISVPRSEEDPDEDLEVNVRGTLRVLETATRLGAQEIRLASSAAVYGDLEVPIDEDRIGRPSSFYGLNKWVAEQYLRHWTETHGQRTVILRLANVYGPRQRTAGEGGVVAVFCETLAKNGTPTIHGDGRQIRDFVSVADVARAFTHEIGHVKESDIYNVSTETPTSILELWNLLAGIAGVSTDRVQFGDTRPGDIRESVLSNRKAWEWGVRPKVLLREGLAETYRYFLEQAGGRMEDGV